MKDYRLQTEYSNLVLEFEKYIENPYSESSLKAAEQILTMAAILKIRRRYSSRLTKLATL